MVTLGKDNARLPTGSRRRCRRTWVRRGSAGSGWRCLRPPAIPSEPPFWGLRAPHMRGAGSSSDLFLFKSCQYLRFEVEITVPRSYPFTAPKCRFLTKVGHLNIDRHDDDGSNERLIPYKGVAPQCRPQNWGSLPGWHSSLPASDQDPHPLSGRRRRKKKLKAWKPVSGSPFQPWPRRPDGPRGGFPGARSSGGFRSYCSALDLVLCKSHHTGAKLQREGKNHGLGMVLEKVRTPWFSFFLTSSIAGATSPGAA